jgi:hypothetical protein
MGEKVTFHPATKIIQIDIAPVLEGDDWVVDIDAKIDLYSDGKEDWLVDSDLNKLKFAMASSGGDAKPGGELGATFFMEHNWKIRPYEGDHWLRIDGNLFARDGSNPFVKTIGDYNVVITQNVSDIVEVVSSDLGEVASAVWDDDISGRVIPKSAATAVKASTYEGSITLDPSGGTPGTGWPIGTHFKPSSNLTDALLIMLYGNVDELVLESSLTVGAIHDISGKAITTHGIMGTVVTFEAGARSDRTALRHVDIQGEIYPGDEMLVESCSVLTLDNFKGVMNNVAFGQGAEVSFSGWATIILGTAGGEPTNEVEFSLNAAAVNVSNWTGPLKLTNKTGSNRTAINCSSGCIIIDSSCVAGIIQLLGVGHIESDNSGPGCIVDTDSFVSIESITAQVWEHADAVFLKNIEGGRWRILNNQMIFYKEDNLTEIARFNLFDSSGSPTETNVYERQRV